LNGRLDWIIIEGIKTMSEEKLAPVHPGEVLLEEFLKPMELSQNRVAINIGVPARRINEIVLGKRRVSAGQRGYGVAVGTLFWDVTPVLVRVTDGL
jgi:hypothetical protein